MGKQSQQRGQNGWCRQGDRQNENAHFYFSLSLAGWLTFPLSTFFSMCIQCSQSAHDELMLACEVSWHRREPHTWDWLDHPLTTLTLTKVFLQVGPTSYKGGLAFFCARLWEKPISHFMPILIFIVSYEPSLFLKLAYPTFYFMEIAYPLWKVIEVMCVLPYTHTQKKIKSSTPWKQQRALFSSLFLILLIIPKAYY